MKKLIRKLGVLFTVLLLATSVSTALSTDNAQAKRRHSSNTIRVTYTLKNNKKRIARKTIHVRKHTTVLAGLRKCWKVKASHGFVTRIHGYSQNKGKRLYWTYTVNGKWASAANKVYLHNKDRVVWTRSKF